MSAARTTRLAPGVTPAATSPARALALAAGGVGALTLLIRVALHGRAFDLFGDEVVYTGLGRSVISGGFPRFSGNLFFLHGPAFFYLEAGWAHLVGHQPGLIAWVYQMRLLNALLAAATAVVVVLLAGRASSPWAGAAAGLVFALDPFCIRQNDRVLLETSMMFWVLLGYLVFSSLAGHPAPRRARLRAAGAGLLFGCAVLTKDEAALLTLLPLLAAGVLRWGPRRSLIVLTATTTVAVYAAYVAAVAASGYVGVFWAAKSAGVQRLLGLLQVSGFHSPGGGSLTARLTAEAGSFLPTYAVLVLAVPALLVLRRGGHLPRILGLLYCAAGAALAYALIAGTLEEQELYLLVLPSLLIIPVAATLLPALSQMRSRPAHKKRRWRPRAAAMLSVLALAAGLNVWTCIQWARQPDDGFARLLRYMAAQVPPGTAVTVAAGSPMAGNSDGGRYALQARYKAGLWATPAALRGEHVRYILAEWGSINEGFAYLSTGQVLSLVRPGREVFSFWGRTYGHLALYKLPSPAGQQPRRRQFR